MNEGGSGLRAALGGLLTLLGALWVLLSGGCTLFFVGTAATETLRGYATGANVGALMGLLGIGAVCIAPGAVMLWVGLHLLKTPGRETSG
jgi:hypothetical protein